MAALRLRPVLDLPSATDAELVRAGATGTSEAFAELYRRHSPAAVRVARGVLANGDDAADAVAEAFTKVFGRISGGRLPGDVEFRPYLLATTRNAAVDQVRRAGRLAPTADMADVDPARVAGTQFPGSPRRDGPPDSLVANEESELVARAFRDLPGRWQSVLWLTEVEGVPPREAAEVLGLSANNVAQLATRARARLRERFLQAHVRNHAGPGCQATVDRLGAYLAGTLPPGTRRSVDEHLAGCDHCRARLAEVEDLGAALRRAVIPLPVLAAMAQRLAGGNAGRRGLRNRRAVTEPEATATAGGEAGGSLTAMGNVVVANTAPLVHAVATSPVATMAPVIVAEPAARLVVRAAAGLAGVLLAILPGGDDAVTTPKAAAALPPPAAAATTTTVVAPTTVPAPPDTAAVPAPPASPAEPAARPAAPAPAEPAARPAAPAPADPGPLPTTNHPSSTVAHALGPAVGVYAEPVEPGTADPVLVLENPLPSGAERVFLVTGTWGDWYEVLLPVRPNGSTGWVHRSEVDISTHDFSIVVELGAHRITVFEGDQVLLSEAIGVGRANTPTPGGLYFTKELVEIVDGAGRLYPDGPYGRFAYGLSGFSEVLETFAGGDGTLGIHGTNDPSSLGRDVSHGCIRMSNEGITALAGILPLGVPVEVRP